MKIKVSTINKWILWITMAAALSLFKPIGEILPALSSVFAFDYAIRWAIIFLIVVSITLLMLTSKKRSGNRFIWRMVFIVYGAFFLRLGLDYLQGRSVYKELNAYCTYLYIILAITIYELLKRGTISIDKLIDKIIFFTLLSYALRASISWWYAVTGQRILNSIALEGAAENWFRNGTLRVNAPCFTIIMIPLCFYRFLRVGTARKKSYYAACMGIVVWYSAYIHCSRALVIYQTLEILFCVYISKKSAIKSIVFVLLGLLAAGILLGNGIVDYFVDMFSASNSIYGYSNNIRLFEYPHFFRMFLDNFWLGKGLLLSNQDIGGISDCGLLLSLVLLGAPMLVFFLSWIGRDLAAGLKAVLQNADSSSRILILGSIVSVMMTICSIDCFFSIFAYAVPYALAITEYGIARNR